MVISVKGTDRPINPSKESEWFAICKNFVEENQPSMLMIHLVECVKDSGPTSVKGYTLYVQYVCNPSLLCRCETFNSILH